jgi:D-galactonate transporter
MTPRDVQSSPVSASTYLKISRRIVAPLLLAYIIAYLDRVNIGFAKLQMLEALHFSETTYGLGAGVFFIGYFLFGVPANLVLHRVGARRWLAGIMVCWGLISSTTMFIANPLEFYVLRFLLGIAEAGFFPGVIFYLTQWFPTDRRARVTALFMSGIAICGALGSPISGWIMQTFDSHAGWAGWQWLFLLEALPATLMGLYLLVRLDDNLARASWLGQEEKADLSAALAQGAGVKPDGTLADALRDGRVWLVCLIYFCVVTGLYGIAFWLPTIISEMGIRQPVNIGLVAAVPYTVAAIGMVLVGRSADKQGERRWHVAVPAALGAVALIVSAMFPSHRLIAMTALTVATWGILTAPPLVWSIPTPYLRGAAAAGAIALINSFGNLAGFASPYAVGWTKDLTGSTASGMYLVAMCVLLGACLVVIGIRGPSRTESNRADHD